jgi:transposase
MRRGPNLTVVQRDQIIGMLAAGCTCAEAARVYGRTERCIRDIRTKYAKTGTTEDRPRSGRPPVLSLSQKKITYRKARAAPKIEYSELAQVGVFVNTEGIPSKPPSRSTLYRFLRRRRLINYRAKVRPQLNRIHAYGRRVFCRSWRHFPWRRRTVKFSDECSFQKGSGKNTEWVFRFSWEKWKREMITESSTSRKPAQMVWACIWLDERGHARRSKLVIMERDPDAKKYGYSAQSYIKTLTKGLLPHYRRSQYFMHDNAAIHTARVVRSFLTEHHITPIQWPAYSPDLNPIEHLWHHLKRRMYYFYPQYNNYSVAQEEWDGFCVALKECWRPIPASLIQRLIKSMPRRIDACRRARGWQTKY